MFQFPGFALLTLCIQVKSTWFSRRSSDVIAPVHRCARSRSGHLIIEDCQVGFPIRTSRDQRVLSPPPDLSQSATSFIASCCQGIHQTPLSRLIRSRRRRALLREVLVRNLNPLPALVGSRLDPRRRYPGRRRQAATISRSDAAFSVSVIRLGKTVWLPDARRRPCVPDPPDAGRVRPHSADARTASRVIALFTMSVCRMSPSGGQYRCRDLAIGQEGASAMRLPIGSSSRPEWWVGRS